MFERWELPVYPPGVGTEVSEAIRGLFDRGRRER